MQRSVVSLSRLDLELKDHEGSTALWLALQYITVASDASVNPFEDHAPVLNGTSFDENSFAARLIQRGSDPDAPDAATGAGVLQTSRWCRLQHKEDGAVI